MDPFESEEKEYMYGELQAGWGPEESLPPLVDMELDKLTKVQGYEPSSWRPFDPAQYYDSEPTLPTILHRQDGQALIYPGLAHSFVGPFESLKTWCAMLACKEVMAQGGNVIYLDFEGAPAPFFRRMRTMGVPLYTLMKRMAYIQPRDPLLDRNRFTSGALELGVIGMTYNPQLIVTDGVTEAYSLHGWDVNVATDVARYHKLIHRRFSGSVTTIEIDHVAKDPNPMGRITALGSQHKESGIDGAVFEFRVQETGGIGGRSSAAIYLVKDREGYLNSIANKDRFIGTFVMENGEHFIQPNTGEEDHDFNDLVYKSICNTPSGNKSLAEDLGASINKVRFATRSLEKDGLITRDEKQRWTTTAPLFGFDA